ncbi:MAG: SDR family NAD(P)-dependent oxidoreductase, partial [Pyrinomonadaceae bacterium]
MRRGSKEAAMVTSGGSLKLALVTGGSRGIGRAIARRLRFEGLQVAIADLFDPHAPLEGVEYHHADISRQEDVEQLAKKLATAGGVDVLVNNAGVRGPTAPVIAYPLSDWEAVLAVNLTAAFLCCRAFAPGMQKKEWGRVINISSMAGKTPYPLRCGYATSKWGLIGFTLTLAQELGSHGITVNAVCPGPVENSAMLSVMQQRAVATGKPLDEVRTEYFQHLAIPRLPGEEDVAA